MARLGDDVGIDVEVDDGKSHIDHFLQVSGQGAGISPFIEKLIVEGNAFLNLCKVVSPACFSHEVSFVDFEGLTLLKKGTILDRPDSKTEIGKASTVRFGDGERDLPLHSSSLSSVSSGAPLNYRYTWKNA